MSVAKNNRVSAKVTTSQTTAFHGVHLFKWLQPISDVRYFQLTVERINEDNLAELIYAVQFRKFQC